MLQRTFYSIILISILFVLGSCSQNKKKSEGLSPINPKVEKLDAIKDSAMLVRLEKVDDENITVAPLDGNRQKTYSYKHAKLGGQIKGSLAVGDTLSIFPETKTKQVLISINVSELSGRWFYNMTEHRGLIFEKNGTMSTINALTISHREWKLINGKLYIYYVDMQQAADERHQYLVEEAEIRYLDKDKLELSFLGRDYICQRQNEVIKMQF